MQQPAFPGAFTRSVAWRLCALLAFTAPQEPRMTVLVYHGISREPGLFNVHPDLFEHQVRFIKKHYDVVPLARAFAHAAGNKVARSSVALTFDDGYADFATSVLPILTKYQIPATVFVLGAVPDRAALGNHAPLLSDEEITKLSKEQYVTVGSHGLSHKKMTRLSPEDLTEELIGSRERIASLAGATPQYLAYPKGSHNESVETAARSAGYAGAVSVIERGVRAHDSLFALPRIQIDGRTDHFIFSAKLTSAADWYYRLWRLGRRARGS